jgi:hypothetical protein
VQYTDEVCPVEGSCWISILSLMHSEEVRCGNYQISGARKDSLLNIRRQMTESLLFQIPPLAILKRFIDEQSLSGSASSGNSVIKPATSLSAFSIVDVEDRLYETLRTKPPPVVIPLTLDEERAVSHQLCAVLEDIAEADYTRSLAPRCQTCGKPAENQCSVCRAVVYCDSECQLKDWHRHKADCVRR